MLFNSYEFILMFLPATFFIYFYLNKKRLTDAATAFLVIASLFFYSWWNIVYLPLILVSMVFNFIIGTSLTKEGQHKRVSKNKLLAFGISADLALLGYYKYSDFFISNLNHLYSTDFPLLHLLLPLGISFFTFTQIAYLVDSYRGETKEYDLLNYALFVTFFPHLLAGPILHHKEMMPQFDTLRNKIINYKNISVGLFLFSIGLFKKVIIADTFAVWATNGFDKADMLTFAEAWATSLSYTFQLYFDFSGYTDMAIGAALLFNILLPNNFDSPYKAGNIQDFWRRWHITLSRFLRDYIYIPMGGNRGNANSIYRNLMITFLLGGLWHGAGWTFIFWGFLHGSALVIHRLWHQSGRTMSFIAGWFITFNFINVSWVFFRAKEWEDAVKVLRGMSGMDGFILPKFLESSLSSLPVTFGNVWPRIDGDDTTFPSIVLALLFVLLMKNTKTIKSEFQPNKLNMVLLICCFTLGIMSITKFSEFLYFNF